MSVVSMTEKLKSTPSPPPALQNLLIGRGIFGQGCFFAAAGTLGILMEEMNGGFRTRLAALIWLFAEGFTGHWSIFNPWNWSKTSTQQRFASPAGT